jgi:cyclophilin family peptidyl-prolyl cis-trans isomerase/HEAT repeat protein
VNAASHRRSLALLSCLALTGLGAACAPVVIGPVAAPAVVRLSDDDVRHVAELLRMEDSRVLDEALVRRLLEDPLPEVRRRAILAAGRVRDTRATPLVLHGLQDRDAGVRAAAALALGLLPDTSESVLAALQELTRDGAAQVAAEAAAVLGRTARETTRPALLALLRDDRVPAEVRREALLAVWRLPRDETTSNVVRTHLADPDAETRWRASYALMRTGGTAVVAPLIDALADDDDRTRANAARGLRASVVDSAGERERALAALMAAASDPHPHVRINALRLLPQYRDSARTTPVLLDGTRDTDINVAIAAVQALGDSRDAGVAAVLRGIAADTARADGLRTAALAAAVRLDPSASLSIAAAWMDSTRWILRYHAARSGAGVPWDAAAALLQRLARDSHDVVAAEALNAVRTVADTTQHARRLFIEALAVPGVLTRAAAIRGLGRTGGGADLDLLLQAYEHSLRDASPEASLAAVEALGRLRAAGVPADRSFFARFGARGAPANPRLHAAISAQLGTTPESWGTPQHVPGPRPIDFYVDVVRRLVAPALAGSPLPLAGIMTPHGEIVLELAAADAPLTVHSYLTLIQRGYYEGTRWHRVVPNFVIQDGDPRGDGSGGPGYAIRDEINALRYVRGTLGMALSGPDTGGGQFFITHSPQPHLDAGYTIFGRVLDGMHAVDRVVQEEPILGFRRIR